MRIERNRFKKVLDLTRLSLLEKEILMIPFKKPSIAERLRDKIKIRGPAENLEREASRTRAL